MSDKKTLLLRFAELEIRNVRRELDESECIELQGILRELSLTREEAIEESKTLVVSNYDKSK